MASHKDNEDTVDDNAPLVNVTLGGTRVFWYSNRGRKAYRVLAHGDMMVATGGRAKRDTHGVLSYYDTRRWMETNQHGRSTQRGGEPYEPRYCITIREIRDEVRDRTTDSQHRGPRGQAYARLSRTVETAQDANERTSRQVDKPRPTHQPRAYHTVRPQGTKRRLGMVDLTNECDETEDERRQDEGQVVILHRPKKKRAARKRNNASRNSWPMEGETMWRWSADQRQADTRGLSPDKVRLTIALFKEARQVLRGCPETKEYNWKDLSRKCHEEGTTEPADRAVWTRVVRWLRL